ncbi:MAG: hypothetical protein IKH35_01535 [Prevotella sp.]|nr:hypothetical protein [Prevotella sp.]MBR3109855.1 hypothetical protein [Prevotella sp.]
MELNELIKDCACRQKKGLHFILTSILIWAMICAVHLTDMPINTKNLITFCCSAVLFPMAWMLSKVLKIDFEGKGNPLTKAGILFSINQMLYILIVMWVYAAVPEKMVMVYAMVFGAHLMPFSWLYDSRSYMVFSIVVPILSLIVGLIYPPAVLAALMIVIEAVFSVCLFQECKK